MRMPEAVEFMGYVFESQDDFIGWVAHHLLEIRGPFCFAAKIGGWYILAEWNGNPDVGPRTIARHTRKFWEFDALENYTIVLTSQKEQR